MKAKFGMVVVAGSGKIGGHVASRNRGGAYFRTKVTPVNPQTSYQTTVRARLTTISQTWRTIGVEDRNTWNTAVTNFAKTDIFGDLKNPSGFNLYQRLNNNLITVGQSIMVTAPNPEGVDVVTITSIIPDESSQLIPMVLSGAVPSNTAVKVYATAGLSPGKSFVKNEFRLITTLAPDAATPVALGAAYTAKFGAFNILQVIFFKLVFVNINTGQESESAQFRATVVA